MLDTYSYAAALRRELQQIAEHKSTGQGLRDLERLAHEMEGLCAYPPGCDQQSYSNRRMCPEHLRAVGGLLGTDDEREQLERDLARDDEGTL